MQLTAWKDRAYNSFINITIAVLVENIKLRVYWSFHGCLVVLPFTQYFTLHMHVTRKSLSWLPSGAIFTLQHYEASSQCNCTMQSGSKMCVQKCKAGCGQERSTVQYNSKCLFDSKFKTLNTLQNTIH